MIKGHLLTLSCCLLTISAVNAGAQTSGQTTAKHVQSRDQLVQSLERLRLSYIAHKDRLLEIPQRVVIESFRPHYGWDIYGGKSTKSELAVLLPRLTSHKGWFSCKLRDGTDVYIFSTTKASWRVALGFVSPGSHISGKGSR